MNTLGTHLNQFSDLEQTVIVLAINHFGDGRAPYATRHNLLRFDVAYAHECVRAGLQIKQWNDHTARRRVEIIATKLRRLVLQALPTMT